MRPKTKDRTTSTTEMTSITVEIALISGEMPERMAEKM